MSHGRHLRLGRDNLTAPRTPADAVDAALAIIHGAIYDGHDVEQALWSAGAVLESSSSVRR